VALHEVEVSSVVPAAPERVWARVSTFAGVNDELMPFFRMTCPRAYAGLALDPALVPLGVRVFRSWILLFGVVPVDWDDLGFARLDPDRGFHERSTMLSQRRWEHERTLAPVDGGCRVTDRIRFEPRVPGVGGVFAPLFRFLFRHRHRRLAAFFRERT
jgi:ligand-binding SRPBCC domain-containing protein